jgi:hypothetical protein
MSRTSLKVFPFPSILDTSSADIVADFFTPALNASVRYDRGVGFFSAGWLRMNAQGMANFARNSGRARWVTSPILSEEDWQALQLGETARHSELLRWAIERNLDDLEQALGEKTLSALAWLVADGILDFKLALPRNKLERGEFHDKFGVFTDADGNRVSFNGSYNDSIQGTRNYESIKVFCSWQSIFADLVRADAERFEKLWNNLDPNVQVFDLPEAAHARIVRLRKHERPYPEPDWERLRLLREAQEPYLIHRLTRPHIPPHIKLRDYQSQAIDAWFAHDCRGLLEMATGTGKTIAALAASARLYEREERLVVRDAISRLFDRSPYQDNPCLVTAREAGYRDAPFGSDFVRCDVQAMDDGQIAALVDAWCRDIPELEADRESAERLVREKVRGGYEVVGE